MTRRKNGQPWTEERIRSFGVKMPAIQALDAVFGVGPTKAYEMIRNGTVDLPLICPEQGRRGCYVPTSAVLTRLQLGTIERGHQNANHNQATAASTGA